MEWTICATGEIKSAVGGLVFSIELDALARRRIRIAGRRNVARVTLMEKLGLDIFILVDGSCELVRSERLEPKSPSARSPAPQVLATEGNIL
ncbi:hypothetical protein [Sphingobium sp. EP60837]|uniref:hypothetical protein n=1 Tax=Sphingobium sp. EP60837 TaxID=1855519 RepID=UPI0012E94A4C|nr:hypothetical protein [Sphingobium sp. EP60837]